jgi:hypothetical protein
MNIPSNPSGDAREDSNESTPPLIIDLGKQGRKKIKQLKKGEGPLAEEIQATIDEVKAQAGDRLPENAWPVIIVYEKKPKKSFFPF